MGKYAQTEQDIYSIFGTTQWKSEGIKTFPENFSAVNTGEEFIRVAILAGQYNPTNPLRSISGQVIIDIFIPAGATPKRANIIADKLDDYLVGKIIPNTNGATQFFSSSLSTVGGDPDDPTLFRTNYSINFSYCSNNL
jgi:hypothetical protein